jgi:hypothetical protein
MISESSLYIARADDRSAARAAMGTVLDRFLNGLELSAHQLRPASSRAARISPGSVRVV